MAGGLLLSKSGVLQVCISCKRPDLVAESDDEASEGQRLFDAVRKVLCEQSNLSEQIVLQPVECMNGCEVSCTAALRGEGKYNFVIGQLDASAERVEDLLSFAKSFADAENGLPAWRERPVHIRKNIIARLHPLPTSQHKKD